jgi:hypothetical protein
MFQRLMNDCSGGGGLVLNFVLSCTASGLLTCVQCTSLLWNLIYLGLMCLLLALPLGLWLSTLGCDRRRAAGGGVSARLHAINPTSCRLLSLCYRLNDPITYCNTELLS